MQKQMRRTQMASFAWQWFKWKMANERSLEKRAPTIQF